MTSNKISFLIDHNCIIKSLYYKELSTVADLSTSTGKSIPNVIKVLNELIKEGYVAEKGFATSSGGRKPLNYTLVPDIHFLLSVAIDQVSTQMVIVDMNNRFVTQVTRYEFDLKNLQVETFVDYLKCFINSSKITKKSIIGIGITIPGFVDVEKGINHTYLKAADQNLVKYIEQHIGIPVFFR